MGFYESFAKLFKFGSVTGQRNLGRFYLLLLGVLTLPIFAGTGNNIIMKIANTPLPLFTEFRWGQLIYILVLIGLIGFWRKKL